MLAFCLTVVYVVQCVIIFTECVEMYKIENTKDVSICISTRNDFDKRVINGVVSSCDMGLILCVKIANHFDNQALTTSACAFDRVITVNGAFSTCESDYKFGMVRIAKSCRWGEVKNNSLYNGGRQRVFCRYRL